MYSFEWDNNKNKANIKKHGIDFNEASTVFYDDSAIMFDDPEHSDSEGKVHSSGNEQFSKCLYSVSLL